MKITVIDVGGTFIKHALMNEHNEILERGKIPTPMSNRADFIKTIVDIHNSYAESEGVALSMPGIIDAERGICITSGALEYNTGANIIAELRAELSNNPIKITLENDAKCAALAEAKVGALSDVRDGFVMIFGTAIGGAFIKDHKVHRGMHFSAGEVSFIVTERGGDPIDDNFFGFQCGVPQLCEAFARQKNLPSEQVDGVMLFDAVNQNDPSALECLDQFTRQVAVQILNLQMILDPERFAIGGGISAQPKFLESIRKNLVELQSKCRFDFPRPSVVTCKFQNDANLIGALQHFLA